MSAVNLTLIWIPIMHLAAPKLASGRHAGMKCVIRGASCMTMQLVRTISGWASVYMHEALLAPASKIGEQPTDQGLMTCSSVLTSGVQRLSHNCSTWIKRVESVSGCCLLQGMSYYCSPSQTYVLRPHKLDSRIYSGLSGVSHRSDSSRVGDFRGKSWSSIVRRLEHLLRV